MRSDNVLRCHRQDVERDALRMLLGKRVETRCKRVEIFASFGFEQSVVIPLYRVPESQPLDEVIRNGGITSEETGGIASVVGECLLENFPAILSLSPGQAEGHIGISLAINVRYAQGVTLDAGLPGLTGGAKQEKRQAAEKCGNRGSLPASLSLTDQCCAPHSL